MKKFGFLAVILMLVGAVMLVTPQPEPVQADVGVVMQIAQADPPITASQACKYIRDAAPEFFNDTWDNLGDCVSDFRTGPVGFCKWIGDNLGFPAPSPPFPPWKNQGDCVSDLRPF